MGETVDHAALKHELAIACRILGREGHDDSVFGHLSVRVPGQDRLWMKGHDLGLDEIGDEDSVLLDLDGKVLEGTRRRHGEYPIHTEVLHARPDVMAVVHTHPPYGVMFGASEEPLRPVSHEGSFFHPHGVPRFTLTSDLILTRERGEAVAKTLDQARAVMLQNHGVVVVGRSIREATVGALVLEKACRYQLSLIGKPYAWSTDEDTQHKQGYIYDEHSINMIWNYYLRRHGLG